MPFLNLKPNHQALQTFYREIKEKRQLSFLREGAVAPHFSRLLQACGRQFNWTLIEQYPIARKGQHPLKTDGARLAELHVNYEQQPECPLQFVETPGEPLNWRVEEMRLSKDKNQIKYNEFLTLAGIPPEVFAYKLGNRSALEWVIDRHQVSSDKRSGIVNEPNNLEDEQPILSG